MQIYVSNKEIAQIAEGLVHMSCGKPPPRYIDIEAIIKYLGLTVRYEQIAEDDQDTIGFASDGVYPLRVFRNGRQEKVVFPKDTIVLDKFLLNPAERNRRRFVTAHEISHILISRADPFHAQACFHRSYDPSRAYDVSELRERMKLAECQANAMAAMILMPVSVITAAVRKHFGRDTIPVYGDCVFMPRVKPILQQISTELGVSYMPMIIQLDKYGLLEKREMHEYFQKMTIGERR